MLLGEALHLLVIDLAAVGTDAVLRGAEQLAGEVDLGAVRQVTAVVETHAENGIARLHQREIRRRIRLRSGMRLHVGVVGAEQLLGALDRQLLGHVDVLAAAVVALAGIAFRVLVGEHRALRLQHPWTGVVLRSDELDVLLLAAALALYRARQLGIEAFDSHGRAEHARRLRGVKKSGARIVPERCRSRLGSRRAAGADASRQPAPGAFAWA